MGSFSNKGKDYAEDNPKLSGLLSQVLSEIEKDRDKFSGQDISVIINQRRYDAVDAEIRKFADKWYLGHEDVRYEVYNYKDGELANENKLKDSADYAAYKDNTPDALPKFKFRKSMIDDFRDGLMAEVEGMV